MSALRTAVTAVAMLAGVATLGTAASASDAHLTDSQYIAAAHCQGLFDAHSLGAVDASGINGFVKSEGAYRTPDVLDRAEQAKNDAMGKASRAGALARSGLVAERDGACQVWAKAGNAGTASR